MLQSLKKTTSGLVAMFKDGSSVRIGETIPFSLTGTTTVIGSTKGFAAQFVTLQPGLYIISGYGGCTTAAVTGFLVGLHTNSADDSTGRVFQAYDSGKATGVDAATAITPADKDKAVIRLDTATTYYLKGLTTTATGVVNLVGAFIKIG